MKKELPDLKTLNVKDKDLLVHYANLLIRHIEQNSNDKLPKFDAGDKHADYNFVFRFMQIIGAWNQEQHGEFLKDLYEDDSIAFNNLATAFNCTKAAILKIISAKEVKGEFVVSNHDFVNIWPINIGEPKMAFKKKAAAKSSKYAMEEGVEETGEEVEEVEEVATKPKRATKKKVAKKAAKTESEEGENFSKAKVLHGEGEPKMEVRREIQALVPKGKRGINYATLVGKVIEAELLKTDKAVARHLAKMKELGFITY